MWQFEITTYPIARKEYHCDASEYIDNMPSCFELSEEDNLIYEKAMEEKFKIFKWSKYIKVKGKYDGEFCIFRARLDLHDLCVKYGLYPDD